MSMALTDSELEDLLSGMVPLKEQQQSPVKSPRKWMPPSTAAPVPRQTQPVVVPSSRGSKSRLALGRHNNASTTTNTTPTPEQDQKASSSSFPGVSIRTDDMQSFQSLLEKKQQDPQGEICCCCCLFPALSILIPIHSVTKLFPQSVSPSLLGFGHILDSIMRVKPFFLSKRSNC